tara:strand:- start:90 stop:383 length:294 start_codon:yes stop_codon:yes gene_type:complete
MKKAYTITIVSETRQGKAVIMAKSYKDAMSQAVQACPEGFRVFEVQENGREQRISGFARPRAPRCALGGIAEQGKLYKPSRKPAFWTGKKTGDFKKC